MSSRKTEYVAKDTPTKAEFAGRENDAVDAVKPGSLKDRLAAWNQTAAASGTQQWKGRENDASSVCPGASWIWSDGEGRGEEGRGCICDVKIGIYR